MSINLTTFSYNANIVVNCRDQDNTAMNIIIMHVIFEWHKKEVSHWKNIDLIKIDLETFFMAKWGGDFRLN